MIYRDVATSPGNSREVSGREYSVETFGLFCDSVNLVTQLAVLGCEMRTPDHSDRTIPNLHPTVAPESDLCRRKLRI